MILRLEMILSVVSYEKKNIIFYEKNLKPTTNNTFNDLLKFNHFKKIGKKRYSKKKSYHKNSFGSVIFRKF